MKENLKEMKWIKISEQAPVCPCVLGGFIDGEWEITSHKQLEGFHREWTHWCPVAEAFQKEKSDCEKEFEKFSITPKNHSEYYFRCYKAGWNAAIEVAATICINSGMSNMPRILRDKLDKS